MPSLRIAVCISTLITLWCSPCRAAEYTLGDLYRLALVSSEKIGSSVQDLVLAKIGRDKAFAGLLPTVSAFGNHTQYSRERYNDDEELLQPHNSSMWGARLEQQISLSLREITAVRMAGDGVDKSKQDLVNTQEEYLPQVAQAYYGVLNARKDLEIAEDFQLKEEPRENQTNAPPTYLQNAALEQRADLHSLASERARQTQLGEGIAGIAKQLQSLDAEAKRKALSEIQDAQRQRQANVQELSKAADLNARQVLSAPVAGKVQQLAVTTIGGVVQPAQVLMLIVPGADSLEVEVSIQNKDIGFVRVGQKAEIKVNTFPFTRYGVIDAMVVDVGQDAVVVDTPAGANKDAKPDEKQQGLIYKMRLKLAKNWLMVDGRRVELIPGMAVQAEVKTGKRRLIEFFLSPLLRYTGESVRER